VTEFLAGGAVFDVVLGVIAVELLLFCGYFLLRREHLVALDVYANLGAAFGLAAAARLMLASAWLGYPCLLLGAALLSHLCALRLRWLRGEPSPGKRRQNLSPDGFRAVTMMPRIVRFTEVPDE